MAIYKKVETNQGIMLENSYIKIIEQSGNKKKINIRISFFKDKIACNEGKEALQQQIYSFTPNLIDNFIKQGYEYLKTLEEFQDAIDC